MPDGLHRTAGRVAIASGGSPLRLDCGRSLDEVVIAYETYGRPSASRDNAVLVCHALTGSAHAAGVNSDGTRGWWDGLIGPGRAIDTRTSWVICTNVLGGCYGSTGPAALDRSVGRPYGTSFPAITIRDMVRAQRRVLAHLGVERVRAVIGGSMGGMQALEWAALYPELVEAIVPIATGARQSAWSIGFNAIARVAMALGAAAGDVDAGLRLARKVGMMTYRSHGELEERFGRRRSDTDADRGAFDVEGYLERHGRRLTARFDAATYATLTRAMDEHDVARDRGALEQALGEIRVPALCIGISTDVRYPTTEQRALARLLPHGEYREIASICGHDAFLIEIERIGALVAPFIEETATTARTTSTILNETEPCNA
jgi:homoserine O-acetyltransferase